MQKNENRPGYRKTEVGWIPEDWACARLNAVATVVRGGSPRPARSSLYFNGDFIPWITVAEITNSSGAYLYETATCLTEAGSNYSRIFPEGSLLLANSGATLGVPKITMVRACANDGIAGFLNLSDNTSNLFLYYFLSSKTRFLRDCLAPGVGQPNLNTELIGSLRAPFPSLPEQEAIAGVLECWDRGIENLELKIVKKRNIKKGLMQALLSGKIRLPGFGTTRSKLRIENSECGIPEGWKEVQLGELGETYSGLTGKSRDDFGAGKPFIPYMNIYSNALIDSDAFGHVAIKPGEHQNRSQYGDLFFTTSSETPEEVGTSSILLHDVDELYLNSFCFGFRLHDFETLSPEFSRHYFRGVGFRKAMFRIAQGASRYNLSKKYFLQTHIQIPEDIEEQKEIARVLSAQDSEIGTLECKLAVLKDQKRFLLNNLVTGSLRLPEFRIKNSELENWRRL